ncbi:hypothetical protein BGX33_006999 [Mortierella sp. NVP41]|nr:hypothetical protein BGX33_006999 [Mortierella sp. NVP41]
MDKFDNDESEGLVDEDEFHDGLSVAFDEALFPASSQRILKAKIGAKALNSYMNNDPNNLEARAESVDYILRQANIAYRNNSVHSVVIKPVSKMPPSGDIHDYTSLARYYWKNPDTEDGLPYSRYAEKIVYRVKEWFLEEATRMNPNLKYGSLIFGTSMGRAEGVLDMFKVFAVGGDASRTAIDPGSAALVHVVPQWVDASPQAAHERNARNNHGTYFTVQYLSILEFLGRNDEAKAMTEDARDKRVGSQIRRDGAQPYETIRPVSFFYSTFNLQGLMMLSMQAESHGVDLWNYRSPIEFKTMRMNGLQKPVDVEVGGGTIEDAIRYLTDYGSRDVSEWPYPDAGERSLKEVLKMARAASLIYKSEQWPRLIARLEAKMDETAAVAVQSDEGDGRDDGGGEAVVEDGEPNGFLCELGFLSKASLWHCYR